VNEREREKEKEKKPKRGWLTEVTELKTKKPAGCMNPSRSKNYRRCAIFFSIAQLPNSYFKSLS